MDQVFQLYGLASSITSGKTLTIAGTLTASRIFTVPDAAMTAAGQDYANTFTAAQTFSATVTMTDAKDIVIGTTTGSKIGTGSTQKIGFWGATPIVQKTGYGTPTNPANQGSFDATTITLVNLAKHVAQLSLDLKAAGIIGA